MKSKDIKKFEKLNNISLPKDDISEMGVVGTLLSHSQFILKTDYLKPRMFYNRELGCIYHVISSLYEKGIVEIDSFLIVSEIEGNKSYKNLFGDIDNIGDLASYIEDLKMVARSTVEEYELLSKKVVGVSFKRESYIKLTELANYVLTSNEDINAVNLKLQEDVTKFADEYIVNTNISIIGDKVDDLWDKLIEKRKSGYSGLPSKFKNINEYITYENGELVVVGGRAKAGKSIFFLNEAIHKVENGVPTAIFDTEMSDENWFPRILALLSGVGIRKIKNGDYTSEEEDKILKSRQWLKQKPLVHIYDPEWTKDKIYMTAKALKMSMGLGFLIYDYIKVNDTSGVNDKEHNVLGDMTNFLKNKIAGSLDLPVLTGGQMSPKEQRLADSDKINRYASSIVYWIRKTKEEILNDGVEEGNYKVFVDYNRNGQQMGEDEYLNFMFDGDKANINQAKRSYHVDGVVPY